MFAYKGEEVKFYHENNIIKVKRTYQDFGENEKTRWFCVFKDFKGILKKIYFMFLKL